MKRFFRRGAKFLAVALVAFVFLSWFFAYQLTGPRQRVVGEAPASFPFPIQSVQFSTSDEETLRGWFVPGDETNRAIVLLHGYGGDRRQMLPRAKFFREMGFAALLYDARACGESTGSTITFGYREAEDLAAAIGFLKQKGYRDIALLGVSQGGATILLGAEHVAGVRCIVCESCYDELAHAVDNRFRQYLKLPCWLAGGLMVCLAERRTGLSVNEVRPVDRIGSLGCPVFLISGEEDRKTLPIDTHKLFEVAADPKELWMVPGAGHRDLFTEEGYRDKVREFLSKHMKDAGSHKRDAKED